ncbi:hypothetical protein EG835_06995 [bacterium]|nr:hypothetical protein [bacterium]
MGRTKGATAEKTERRVSEVVDRVRLGWTPTEIRDFLVDTEGLSRSQAEKYVALAREVFRTRANVERQVAIGETLERLDFIFRRSVEAGQYRAALAAQMEKSRLLDLPSSVVPYIRDQALVPARPSFMGHLFGALDSAQGERLVRAIEKLEVGFKLLGPDEEAARKAFLEVSKDGLCPPGRPVDPRD